MWVMDVVSGSAVLASLRVQRDELLPPRALIDADWARHRHNHRAALANSVLDVFVMANLSDTLEEVLLSANANATQSSEYDLVSTAG